MTNTKSNRYDVVVVGAGPAGLVLAALLDRRGVSAALIDPNKIVCQHPRASHLDDEVMRILQTIGMDRAEPTYMRQTGFDFYAPDGRCFLKWDIRPGETEQGWQPAYQFFQPDFEAELRGRLAANEHTDLLIGWEATAITESADEVQISIKRRADGAERGLRAGYVVGCDGSRSMVRGLVMKDLLDLNGTKQSVIIDVNHLSPAKDLPRTALSIMCGPVPITHVPIVEPMSRFQFMLGPDEDPLPYEDPTTIYRLLDRFVEPDSYRIMRTDVYEWNAHLVQGWRSGRLMIAGDAAHLMPPMLGQGMCSGLRDVSNLAWKLALVVSGRAPATLLDTYESERSPHVRAMIAESARQANLVAAISRGEDQAGSETSVDRSRKPLGPGLSDHRFKASGTLAPQPRDLTGARMDDLVGYEFAVVVSADLGQSLAETLKRRFARMSLPMVVVEDPRTTAWLSSYGVDAAILRPDRYVYAATKGPEELAAAAQALEAALASEVFV
ncbi:bifunctional 3-(3-hydroxy-phenyl)propionate/3-hydroxycinnamic acid hydroxylase [Kribbella sp. ALI-6-A]|uniref:bifunctional 3-(3-hydroxy-phenyl)propionate/3-hydroxycinnamic acid hydroxylase n=1 Tax=Kribbella sp. ALI-6-A TaxID=1933817 RepID=UPI00143D4519|nr:bifunctional 3-(3-hydroxy-phenyl)propionate/3-hydroxycinnamic acid hydroxylase [Kribbella sp. ALI-6-A]